MKVWVLKNKYNEYLCINGYYSHILVPAEYDCIRSEVVRAEKKKHLTETMKDFNADIKPEYKVKPVQVEMEIRYIFKEIKKEKNNV